MNTEENIMFTCDQKEYFITSVKASQKKRAGILEKGMSLNDAFVYAYLDVCRAPLKGIGEAIKNNGKYESATKARETCIEQLVKSCKNLLLNAESQEVFNDNHKALCEEIIHFYECAGYPDFTIGKAQKWINMALKYACIYDDDARLKTIIHFCHVPIDRYIADPIVNELNIDMPSYPGFTMREKRPFSANEANYSWSKIDDYEKYLACQMKIKAELDIKPALQWEYEKWLEAKEASTKSNKLGA